MTKMKEVLDNARLCGFLASSSWAQQKAWEKTCWQERRPTIVVTMTKKYARIWYHVRSMNNDLWDIRAAEGADEEVWQRFRSTLDGCSNPRGEVTWFDGFVGYGRSINQEPAWDFAYWIARFLADPDNYKTLYNPRNSILSDELRLHSDRETGLRFDWAKQLYQGDPKAFHLRPQF